jgi:hypothetical protein
MLNWSGNKHTRFWLQLVRCKILQFEAVFHDSLASCTKVRLRQVMAEDVSGVFSGTVEV